jgi:uncharacterized membrane protein YvlD (DUF360 family)
MTISIAVATVAVMFCSWLLNGFEASEPLRFAIWLGLINGLVVPLIVQAAYWLVVYTFGLFSLVFNAIAVIVAADIVPGVDVDGFWNALLVAFVITITTMLLSWLLAIDDDISWHRMYTRRLGKRAQFSHLGSNPTPGVIFLEIDGCSEGVLRRAMRGGWMPHLEALIRGGSHVVTPWETGLSSQTGASQAGLLLGHDDGIVAFRWYDRKEKRVMVSSAPRDAEQLEDRLATGHGLLAGGGVSRNNLFGGDASESAMTLSRVLRPGHVGSAYKVFFSQPSNVARTIVLTVRDVWNELVGNLRLRRRGVWPRLDHKGWKYPFLRASTTVVMRDVTCELLVGDIMRGVPSGYATFVGYDEVAHHDGVERPQALEQLRQLDTAFARVMRAAKYAPRPYEFVVLSDHGQSHGATFLQRYGLTLQDLVRQHLDASLTTRAWLAAIEPDAQLGASFTEAADSDGLFGMASRSLIDTDEKGMVKFDKPLSAIEGNGPANADVLVMASGNLGLVYLTGHNERLMFEEIRDQYPGLIDGVTRHKGIGFVLVRSSVKGPIAIGSEGQHILRTGVVTGKDPLLPYGPLAATKLLRHDEFENVPDLLVLSTCDAASDEVAAFEELIGSHGGMGGEQSHAFVLHPSYWTAPAVDMLGAPNVHLQLVRWLEEIGNRMPLVTPPVKLKAESKQTT